MLEKIIENLGDHIQDVVVIADAEPINAPGPRVVWVNQTFTDVTGYAAEDIIGKSPRILQGEGTDPETKKRISEGLKAWKPVRETLLNYRKDGTEFWTELHIKPIADETGWFHYWVAIQRDVTEQKEMMDRLDEAHHKLDFCVSAGDIGVWEITGNQKLSSCSDKNFELLGFDAEQYNGKDWLEFWRSRIHPEDRAKVLSALDNHLKHDCPMEVEYRIQHRNGTYRWWRTTGHAADDNGETQHRPSVSGICMDITDIREAQIAADRANRLKSEFLANMSHEIRTPLNGVLGMAQLLESTDLNPKQKRYVDRIHNAGQTLLGIISDVLDISKIETGALGLELGDFNVSQLMKQVEDSVRGLADSKGLALNFDCSLSPEQMAYNDSNRLRQVLVNLTGNAIKFTETGSVNVRATMADNRIEFEVVDTGPGIPKDKQTEIFERFIQVDGSSTRQHGGTGLGLAIAKDVVELMGSNLQVESELGEGARFFFSIPAPQVNSEDAGVAAASNADTEISADDVQVETSKQIKILAAEDNEMNQLVLEEIFDDDENIALEIFDNGKLALDEASKTKFDLLLLDINMPVMSGDEALRAIRAGDGPNKHTPAFVLTADAGVQNRAMYMASGADDCLIKPLNIEQVRRAVRMLLKQPDLEISLIGRLGSLSKQLRKQKVERRGNRYPCDASCRLDFEDSRFVLAAVKDISKGGARLEVDTKSELPNVMRMKVEGFDDPVLARLAWRRGKSIGIEFVAFDEGDKSRTITEMYNWLRGQGDMDVGRAA